MIIHERRSLIRGSRVAQEAYHLVSGSEPEGKLNPRESSQSEWDR